MNKQFIIIPIMLITFMFACGDSNKVNNDKVNNDRINELEIKLYHVEMKQECKEWKDRYLYLNQWVKVAEGYQMQHTGNIVGTIYRFIEGAEARSEHVRKYRYECINYDVLPPTEPPVIFGQY